ncbi:MAG: VTT domain-containing protein [Algoriphagus sp.]|uniref:VTT domain-containing protein n=1 Tax=Algoriphagus sp. TaxID=1872435 RepID=UPI00276CF8A8|nr:VTT domain-containing protein [Algoriphagus sp.]MDP4903820.1 VTT domain-containing protein [Algoriphagus sp.]MDP4957423.1 VTT domain-containing protein [Algoriphagus sp.]MDP5126150.1 VTT domain-containing protein [Algoriphagus sp.]
MTKKDSIFKDLAGYFRSHPSTTLGWLWVSFVPLLGSLLLSTNYQAMEQIVVTGIVDQVLLSLILAFLVGLAFLPTTLTAIASGFFWGWSVFPHLVIAYLLANVLGYTLGKWINADFRTILYARHPSLKEEIEKRIEQPAGLVFFVRISPVIPFAISNFLFASLGIPLSKIIRFGLPGMLPRTILAFASGKAANSFLDAQSSLKDPQDWLALGLLLLGSVWGIWYFWNKKKTES